MARSIVFVNDSGSDWVIEQLGSFTVSATSTLDVTAFVSDDELVFAIQVNGLDADFDSQHYLRINGDDKSAAESANYGSYGQTGGTPGPLDEDGGVPTGQLDLLPWSAYDATGGQTVDRTTKTLNIDTVSLSDANYTLAADEITVNSDGIYWISYTFGQEDINTSGGARIYADVWVEEDQGTSTWQAIVDSRAVIYHRKTMKNSGGASFPYALSSGDKLRIRFVRGSGTTNVQTIQNYSHISIMRVG